MSSFISALVMLLVISAGAYGVLNSMQLSTQAKYSTVGVRL